MGREEWPKPEGLREAQDFERQFESGKKQLKVTGGIAEVVEVSPHELKDAMPVLLSSGWGTTNEVAKIGLESLYERGRKALAIEHPHHGGDMTKVPREILDKYPTEELRKAMDIIDVLDQKGIEKVDVVAHSEGAISATIAAALHPEKFRNIVFFAPAGLIGEDTFLELLKRVAESGRSSRLEIFLSSHGLSKTPFTEKEKRIAETARKEMVSYLMKNPIRGVKEISDISKSKILELIKYIHGKGVGTVIMAPVDDLVFPIDRMVKIIGPESDKALDGFLSVKGKHSDIVHHPEKYFDVIDNMLDALQKKKETARE